MTALGSNFIRFIVAPVTSDEFVGVINRFEGGGNPTYSPLIAEEPDNIDTITFTFASTGGQVGDEMIFQDLAPGLWFIKGLVLTNNPVTGGILSSTVFG